MTYIQKLPVEIREDDNMFYCGVDYMNKDEHRIICDYKSPDFFDVARHLYDTHLAELRDRLNYLRDI